MQIDATSIQRRPTTEQIDQLYKKFNNLGCEIVVVGGEATDPALRRAPGAGYAMSRAQYHVGVDSGYLHLAQLYFQPDNIYLYTNRDEGKWEHHLKMARDNGCHINEY
jgi:ADP-heptose:LPS heptosyltransferase